MTLNNILLQQAGAGMDYSGIIMIVAMIAIFYFFIIRPQQKKQKELKKQRESMQKGDKVMTQGGIHGKIKSIEDFVVMVEIAEGVVIKVDKTCVFPLGDPNAKK